MKLRKLNAAQSMGWGTSSMIYGTGLIVVFFTIGPGGTAAGASSYDWVAVAVFGAAWLVGVAGLRYYLQDKDPASFHSLLGLDKSDRR